MAGRWMRKFSLTSCLVMGAFGCNRNTVQSPAVDVQPGQAVPTIPTAINNNKSLWGNSSSQSLWGNSTPQAAAAPVELVVEAPRKGPAKPETEVAIADLRLQLALDEKTPDAKRAGLLDLARHGYQKALQNDPKNNAALLGLARYYSRMGDREKTMETYNKYLALNPSDREVMHEIAIMYGRWQDWNNAVAWCNRALKLDPENLSYTKSKAFCLARAGQWEEAFKVFMNNMHMPEAQARYNIARVLEHQNYPDLARQQVQLALQIDPNLADARDLLAEMDQKLMPAAPNDPNAIQRAGFTEDQ